MSNAPLSLYCLGGTLEAYYDVHGRAFDVDAYSRMKHGDMAAARIFAAELAAALVSARPDLVTDPREVLLPVAYRHVPPACYYLSVIVAAILTGQRGQRGLSQARVVKIEKDSVTNTDYATATQQARQAELDSLRFHLTQPVEDAHLVLVDDVRVTGASEAAAMAALEGAGHAELTTIYIATLDESLMTVPQIEATINHATVTEIMDMADQVQEGRFGLTIRFLKRALASPQLPEFLALCPPVLVHRMYDGALRSGEAFQTNYAPGIATLREAVGSGVGLRV